MEMISSDTMKEDSHRRKRFDLQLDANNIYTHTLVTVYYINLSVFQFSITLSKMIPIQQWRIAIGCFHPCGFKAGCTNDFANGKCCFRGKMSFILVISILSLLLVMAGDVELNPGPSRKCPHCQFEIPICQKKMWTLWFAS